jgi:hypothetical protein
VVSLPFVPSIVTCPGLSTGRRSPSVPGLSPYNSNQSRGGHRYLEFWRRGTFLSELKSYGHKRLRYSTLAFFLSLCPADWSPVEDQLQKVSIWTGQIKSGQIPERGESRGTRNYCVIKERGELAEVISKCCFMDSCRWIQRRWQREESENLVDLRNFLVWKTEKSKLKKKKMGEPTGQWQSTKFSYNWNCRRKGGSVFYTENYLKI